MVAAACSASAMVTADGQLAGLSRPSVDEEQVEPVERVGAMSEEDVSVAEDTAGSAGFGTALPPAPIGLEALTEVPEGPRPVTIIIDELDIVEAPVVPVGVNPDETLEVPGAQEVGWYRFGPSPGAEGSSVLAAHIAYDGIDGVFRSLADADPGDEVVVGFDNGSTERFRIVSVTDYLKEDLPDSLFSREGDPQLVLITCGGGFNPDLREYNSNTVVVAIPA